MRWVLARRAGLTTATTGLRSGSRSSLPHPQLGEEGYCGERVFETRACVSRRYPFWRCPVWPVCLASFSLNCYDASVRSTKSPVEIDHSSPVPLHEQVAAAIRRAIAEGEARSGERLHRPGTWPPCWESTPTPCSGRLRTLRDEGLVEFRRGRGVSVTGIAPERSPVVAKARELVAVARRYGYRPEELAAIIEQVS